MIHFFIRKLIRKPFALKGLGILQRRNILVRVLFDKSDYSEKYYVRYIIFYISSEYCASSASSCTFPENTLENRYSVTCSGNRTIVAGVNADLGCRLRSSCTNDLFSSDVPEAICVENSWFPKIPECPSMHILHLLCLFICNSANGILHYLTGICPYPTSKNVDVFCNTGEDGSKIINCNDPLVDGTRAVSKCKPGYRTRYSKNATVSLCTNLGQWDPPLLECERGTV